MGLFRKLVAVLVVLSIAATFTVAVVEPGKAQEPEVQEFGGEAVVCDSDMPAGVGWGELPGQQITSEDTSSYQLSAPLGITEIPPDSIHTNLLCVLSSRFNSISDLPAAPKIRTAGGNQDWMTTALSTYGKTPLIVAVPRSDVVAALQQQVIDAVLVFQHPYLPPIIDAIKSGTLKLLPWSTQAVNSVIAGYPGETRACELPAGTYSWQSQNLLGYAPTGTLTLALMATEDTFVASGVANSNFNSYNTTFQTESGPVNKYVLLGGTYTDTSGAQGHQRILLKFDTSSIPTDSAITSARVALYMYAYWTTPGPATFTSYRITSPWIGSMVTWNNQPSTGASYGNTSIYNAGGGCYWDVTSLVQQWVNGTTLNYGVMIKGPETDSQNMKAFLARQEVGAEPILEVQYQLPPIAPSVTTVDFDNVTNTSARLNGELTSLGTASSVNVSFQWGTSPGNYTFETSAEAKTIPGTFSFNLDNLTTGTTYYFRAKAVGDETIYGEEKSFKAIVHTLTIEVNGNGTTDPAAGTYEYGWGTVVNISAIPAPDWQFYNWTGDVASTNSSSTTVTMNASKTVTANFIQSTALKCRIAFTSMRDGNSEIYIMNADGTGQTRLTNNSSTDRYPSPSPDGTRIVFESLRDPDMDGEIYVMNSDGSNQTRLTFNSAYDQDPAWSPDGTRIVFASTRDDNYEIYTMNADGSNQTRLTFTDGEYNRQPAWSPDGSRIVFFSVADNHAEVFLMNADGSNRSRLTYGGDADNQPAWSPDGDRIAFASGKWYAARN